MRDNKIIGDGLTKIEDTPPFKEMRDKVDKLVREEARILRNGKMRLHSTRRDRRPFLSNYGLLTLLHLYVPPPPNATLRELSRARIFYENRPGGSYKDFKRYRDICIYTSPALTLYKDPSNIYILFRGKDKEMDTLLDLLENINFEAFIEEKGYNRKNKKWSKYYKRRVEQEGNGTMAEWREMWGLSSEDGDDDDALQYDNEYALQYENFKKAHQNFSRRLFGKIISSRRFADAFLDANESKDIVSYEKIYNLPANLTDLLTQLKDNGYKSEDMADNDEDGEEKEEGELVEEKDEGGDGEEKEEGELVEEIDEKDVVVILKGDNNYLVDNKNRVLKTDPIEVIGKWNEKTGEAEIEEGWDDADFEDVQYPEFEGVEKFYLYPIKSKGGLLYTKDMPYGRVYKRENGEMKGGVRMIKREEWIIVEKAKNAREEKIAKKKIIKPPKKQDGEGHPIQLRILKNKGKIYYVDNEGIIYNTTSGEQIGTWVKNRPVMY